MYNAPQLAAWCLAHLGHNYTSLASQHARSVVRSRGQVSRVTCHEVTRSRVTMCRMMRSLSPDNQALLNLSRWPPAWYLKDAEIYARFTETRAAERERTSSRRKRQR